jgi:hypothetical protein
MPQNQQSGAAANSWGRECAKSIAQAIGAQMIDENSNEAILNGEHVGIHCAGKRTKSIGASTQMLAHIVAVLGAFEQDEGAFDVYRLPSGTFQSRMRPTASHGPSHGRVGIVSRKDFEEEGDFLGTFEIG